MTSEIDALGTDDLGADALMTCCSEIKALNLLLVKYTSTGFDRSRLLRARNHQCWSSEVLATTQRPLPTIDFVVITIWMGPVINAVIQLMT